MASTSKIEDCLPYHEIPFSELCEENAENIVDFHSNNIHQEFRRKIILMLEFFLSKLIAKQKKTRTWKNQTIYSGSGGIAYLYFFLAERLNKPHLYHRGIELLEAEPINLDKPFAYSFLTGEAGKLCLIALAIKTSSEEAKKMRAFRILTQMWHDVSIFEKDNLLFGKAGYLYALLFAKKNIFPHLIEEKHVKRSIQQILRNLKMCKNQGNSESMPIRFCIKLDIVGGARGTAGILYVLLQAREFLSKHELDNYIEPSIRDLMSKRFSSGNFPASLADQSDTYVQWCQGAPAMTMLFVLAHQVFGKEEYLQVAKDCGEVVWKRGLLKKSCGLCHGVAGNAYTFLSLFNYTKDPKYLYRACKFAEWCFDYDLHHDENPNLPDTLFNGLPGVMYFLADLLNPSTAKFPGYDL